MFNNSSKRSTVLRCYISTQKVNIIEVCFTSIKMLPVWKKESGPILQLRGNSRKFEEAKDYNLHHVGPMKTYILLKKQREHTSYIHSSK